jgi:hypothetical protein
LLGLAQRSRLLQVERASRLHDPFQRSMKLVAAATMIRLRLDTHPPIADIARSCLDRPVTQHLARSFDVSTFLVPRVFSKLSAAL